MARGKEKSYYLKTKIEMVCERNSGGDVLRVGESFREFS
jgi:hypothetical protein